MENEKSEKVFTAEEILKKEAFLRELGYPEAADMLRQQVGILNRLAEYRLYCVGGHGNGSKLFSSYIADSLDYILTGKTIAEGVSGSGMQIKEEAK